MRTIDIVIPTYNEEKYIRGCLDSVLGFSVPENVVTNILVVDGNSVDKTPDIVKEYVTTQENIKLVKNERKTQSAGMNLAIELSRGDYIMRLDAHSIYEKDYLKICLETSISTGADNVGGVFQPQPGSESYGGKAVHAITSHFFGVGNSGFRIGSEEGYTDTVPFGFFKRSVFDKVGLFDERLLRAQDYELNRRIIKYGGKIWLNPAIKAKYFNQPNLIKFFKKIFFFEAPYNAYMWYFAPYTFSIRHSITMFFTLGFIGGLLLSFFSVILFSIFSAIMLLYFLLAIFSSFKLALRDSEWRHVFFLPIVFLLFHLIHGLGVLYGLFRIMLKKHPTYNL